MELNQLYEAMDLSFDSQVMHNNQPVFVEGIKNSLHGDMAQIRYTDNRHAEVPVAELTEAFMPVEEEEYIFGWMTRMSPLIRA